MTSAAMQAPTWRQVLRSRERWGWVLYDWANSAYVLCIVTVIGSAYFVERFRGAAKAAGELTVGPAPALRVLGVAVTGEAAWALITGSAAFLVAVSSPFLGGIADATGHKKRFLELYCAAGVACTLALWLPLPWWGVGALILAANVAFDGGNVFYNGFLPELASGEEQNLLSSAGYGFGYLGGVLVLIAALAFFTPPRGAVQHAFVLVGLWWGGFALITFAWLPERRPWRPLARPAGLAREAWRDLAANFRALRRVPEAAVFLAAFLLYNDGIATLISQATPYALQNIYRDAAGTRPITLNELIPAIIMIQVVAFPGSLACGWLANRLGQKPTLYLTLAVFTGVVTYGLVAWHVVEFYVMAALIGLVLGGAQAISRSLYASFVPTGHSAAFFAFYALSSKFSAVLGPLVYGGLLLVTGETRLAILSLTMFFAAGGLLLWRVNVPRGRRQAAGVPPPAQ